MTWRILRTLCVLRSAALTSSLCEVSLATDVRHCWDQAAPVQSTSPGMRVKKQCPKYGQTPPPPPPVIHKLTDCLLMQGGSAQEAVFLEVEEIWLRLSTLLFQPLKRFVLVTTRSDCWYELSQAWSFTMDYIWLSLINPSCHDSCITRVVSCEQYDQRWCQLSSSTQHHCSSMICWVSGEQCVVNIVDCSGLETVVRANIIMDQSLFGQIVDNFNDIAATKHMRPSLTRAEMDELVKI